MFLIAAAGSSVEIISITTNVCYYLGLIVFMDIW